MRKIDNEKILEGKKRPKKFKLLIFFSVIVVLISIFVLTFSYLSLKSRPIFAKEYDIYFEVKEGRAGFDINNTFLTYGILPPGGVGVRKIDVENKFDFEVKAKFYISKDLFMYSSFPLELRLIEGEKQTIEVSINVPKEAEEKNYTGKFRIEFYRI